MAIRPQHLPFQIHDCCWQRHRCLCSSIVLWNYYDDYCCCCCCFCDDWMNCTHLMTCPADDHCQYHDQMWWHRCEFGSSAVGWSGSCSPHLLCRSVRGTDFAYHARVLKFSTAHISHSSFQQLWLFSSAFQTDDRCSSQIECEWWCSETEMCIFKFPKRGRRRGRCEWMDSSRMRRAELEHLRLW